ncbi:MAG: hypothetical protein J5911_04005 [Clostridia bacterium]|nr:hypothetical protein [Clostridia bacterium]
MKQRKLNVAALVINLTVFILTAYSVAHNFRQDIVRIPEEVNGHYLTDFTGIYSFRYFTSLSNVFAAIASAITLCFNVKNVINGEYSFPKWVTILKYTATCTVALTFFTVALFLSPLMVYYGKSYFTLFKGNGFFFHFLLPALSIACFTMFEKSPVSFNNTYIAVLPAVAYSIVYMLMVVFNIWPDFYSFTFNERFWTLPITITAIFAISYGISVVIYFMHKKIKVVK